MLPVHRQELLYSDGPRGAEPLADDETLGGAGVAQDGTAELDVQLTSVRKEKANKLGPKVWRYWLVRLEIVYRSHLQSTQWGYFLLRFTRRCVNRSQPRVFFLRFNVAS